MPGILLSLTEGLTITEHADWMIFVERLSRAVESGRVRKVPVLKPVWGGSSEEWFLDPVSQEVYVYAPPSPPSMPTWEKLDVLKYLETPDPPPLSSFKVGQISVMTAHIMKMRLEALAGRGLAEELPVPAEVPRSKDGTERWYKDNVSDVVYRLIEHYPLKGEDDVRWEIVPRALSSGKIQ
jgi:hypothetical protein